MEIIEKKYKTLNDNITYALKRFENAQREIAEGMLLLKSAQTLAEEMSIDNEKSVE